VQGGHQGHEQNHMRNDRSKNRQQHSNATATRRKTHSSWSVGVCANKSMSPASSAANAARFGPKGSAPSADVSIPWIWSLFAGQHPISSSPTSYIHPKPFKWNRERGGGSASAAPASPPSQYRARTDHDREDEWQCHFFGPTYLFDFATLPTLFSHDFSTDRTQSERTTLLAEISRLKGAIAKVCASDFMPPNAGLEARCLPKITGKCKG
jgi:hypothetical protein